MGKTLTYLAVLAVLGFGVYYFLFRSNEGLYREKDANFTVRDTAAIGKIFLVDNDGTSVLLERQASGRWLVNKKYDVIPVQSLNILTCLHMQTALNPVPRQDNDRVIRLMSSLATKVEVYDKKGNKLRVFYVVGQGPNFHGSYMMLEGAEQPYLVEVPGFGGYLSPRFSTDVNDWRSRLVFDLPADSLRSVKVDYHAEPLSSYEVVRSADKKVEVKVDEQLHSVLTDLNVPKTMAYLDFFKNINCEGYLNGAIDVDSLVRQAEPRCRIEVTSVTGDSHKLDIYWMEINKRSKNTAQNVMDMATELKDIDRMYAVNLNTSDTLMIQSVTFEKILRRGYEFYEKDQDSTQMQRRNLAPSPFLRSGKKKTALQ